MGWIFLLCVIILFCIIAAYEYLMYSMSKKEENEDSYITRTHTPKRRTIINLIMTLLLVSIFIVVTVLIIVFDNPNDISFWIAYVFSFIFFISIPMILFLICISDYEIIMKEGIMVHRFFKKKFIKFNEIVYYSFSFNQLIVYGQNDVILFFIGDLRVGIKSLVNELEHHRIKKKQC